MKKPVEKRITRCVGVGLSPEDYDRFSRLNEKLAEIRDNDLSEKRPKKLSQLAREAVLEMMEKVEAWLK